MADSDLPTVNDLKRLRVIDLKQKLSERNLSTSGLKADLVNRLYEACQQSVFETDKNDPQSEDKKIEMEEENEEAEEGNEEVEEENEEVEEGNEEVEEENEELEDAAAAENLEEEDLKDEEAESEKLEDEQRKAEEKRAKEEERIAAEKAEEEQRQAEEETETKRVEQEQRIAAEEAERKQLEEEQRLAAEEAEKKRVEEKQRQAAKEAEKKRVEEEQRLAAEEAEKKRVEEEKRRVAEEAAKKRAEEEKRRVAEEAKKKRAEDDRKRVEAESKRKAGEAERKRVEEAKRKAAEEAKRKAEETKRKAEEDAKKKRAEEEKRNLAQENERKKQAGLMAKKRAEEESRKNQQPTLPRIEAAAGPKKSEVSKDGAPTNQSIEIPQALEKALAFKSERAQQIGVKPGDFVAVDADRDGEGDDEDESMDLLLGRSRSAGKEATNAEKESKNKRKKKKKKRRAKNRLESQMQETIEEEKTEEKENTEVDIEYVEEVLDFTDPSYLQFMQIFEKFQLSDHPIAEFDKSLKDKMGSKEFDLKKKGPPSSGDDSDLDDEKKEDDKDKLSKRKQKMASRLSVAQLKQRVTRPDLVEMHDVTAKDPELLLSLKATRNSVPVPRHWCFKRKYLQGKRGIEKPPFDLPHFIKKTGIMEMRQALADKEDSKTLKAKMRERVRPKMGKIDVDYHKLHDAFFKWQTKPKMTIHGDLYYEGKEFETKMKDKKPGDLSDELRTALGMPVGPNSQKVPPPWLIAMQRYGPPPSYPNLKIPGLNAPIPDNCCFGYHAGGWGKPPVDELGRPLYGDVFGVQNSDYQNQLMEEEIDRSKWGELESESSESSEEEEEEGEEEEDDDGKEKEADPSGLATPSDGGLITPSGITSIPAGMETPDMIELRKRKIEADMEGGDTPALYTILPEKKSEKVGAAMMGSTHVYDLTSTISKKVAPTSGTENSRGGVEVALDPSELDMDTAAMAARYEQTVREQQSQLEKEDLSDMVAEHAAKQKNKRKKAQQDSGKQAKRYKEFKF